MAAVVVCSGAAERTEWPLVERPGAPDIRPLELSVELEKPARLPPASPAP